MTLVAIIRIVLLLYVGHACLFLYFQKTNLKFIYSLTFDRTNFPQQTSFENTVANGEITYNEQILILPKHFLLLLNISTFI